VTIVQDHERVAVCTIASANYCAYAKTLANSVSKHEPNIKFFLLVADRKTAAIEAAIAEAGLDTVFAEDLGIPDLEHIGMKFDIVEFNTAVKPTMLKRLFQMGFEKVIYLDPDIRLFSDLSPVTVALNDNNIVFTPHARAPAMDGQRPSDIDFLRTGVFNLGFVALKASEQSSAMLDWWEERCLAYGFIDTNLGIFVDQKWMNLVPCYFDGVHVLKHLGCNVAYWNLHERSVTGDRDGYFVGDKPLCFFHFSGVKASLPNVLSRHQTRHQIEPGTALAELVSDYCKSLTDNGHLRYSAIKYTFGHFDNGVAVNSLTRRAACFGGARMDDLFSAKGSFYAFAKQHGLLSDSNKQDAALTTMNFDENSGRVRATNGLIRVGARAIGADRFAALTRYISVLAREDGLARVLCKVPFDFTHSKNKTRNL